ncbi:MAG: fatty acid CoA ligase family protein [Deltaproteobacteria bacterium]|jgi:acyl-coenzyme A synthetase/AMP-(fatty) acid ligase|nr:fatty acid CoA ligase family protein [Deltaproteobacteria bacterium]
MTNYANITLSLKESQEKYPYKRAIVYPAGRDNKKRVLYTQMTFTQLEQESDKLAFGLEKIGIVRGVRTILMVPPGMEFFIIIFAMFKVGAVPVVVDPGMGLGRMLQCLQQGKPRAFIGIEKAHLLRKFKPGFFKDIKQWVTVGKRWFWGGYTLDQLIMDSNDTYPKPNTIRDETAAIAFTSGSTGPAKGVIYTHGNFIAQIRQIQEHFQFEEDEIDLPTFPLWAVFYVAIGMTVIIPDIDPTKPALVDPRKIIEAINNHGITNMFASPALLNRVGKFGKENNIKLPSLRRVISAGAPVTPANIEQFSTMLNDHAQIHTPYGATEAVPIISIGSNEILAETKKLSEQGYGMCIGRPICDTRIDIIRISDAPIIEFNEKLKLPENQVGEIIVQADLVTKSYFNDKEANILAKIPDNDGGFWHRMGDLGWKDSKGRIWFCGRKNHRVTTKNKTLFTIPVEAIFNNHEKVFRSALAGAGPKRDQIPVIFIEPISKIRKKKVFINELLDLAKSNSLTQGIKHIFIEKTFPVDIRHNSKIFREKLAVKAQKKLNR